MLKATRNTGPQGNSADPVTGTDPKQMSPENRLLAIKIYVEAVAEDFPQLKPITDNLLILTGISND